MKTPYAVLGVSAKATDVEIARAYRARARQEHPDQNGGTSEAEARMRALNAAYEALKNPEVRAATDASLRQASVAEPVAAAGASPQRGHWGWVAAAVGGGLFVVGAAGWLDWKTAERAAKARRAAQAAARVAKIRKMKKRQRKATVPKG